MTRKRKVKDAYPDLPMPSVIVIDAGGDRKISIISGDGIKLHGTARTEAQAVAICGAFRAAFGWPIEWHIPK